MLGEAGWRSGCLAGPNRPYGPPYPPILTDIHTHLPPSHRQVPDGAPARVKEGEVPPADQDTKFSYLWNCRAWLDQATRVVIATGGWADGHG